MNQATTMIMSGVPEGVMVREVLKKTTQLLKEGKVATPVREAEALLEDTLGLSRTNLYLNYDQVLTPEERVRLKNKIKCRLQGEPLQYLIGRQPFRYLNLKTALGVFIPRIETELLVEYALKKARAIFRPALRNNGSGSISFLDLGTGAGAIALSLAYELPQASGYATDISPKALKLAQENAKSYGLEKRITFIQSDLFVRLRRRGKNLREKFDIIVSNPPYIPTLELSKLPAEVQFFEPLEALDGGQDGLEAMRRIVKEVPQYLRKKGFLALEVGFGQAEKVRRLIEANGNFDQTQVFKNYGGVDRVILATRRPAAGD